MTGMPECCMHGFTLRYVGNAEGSLTTSVRIIMIRAGCGLNEIAPEFPDTLYRLSSGQA